MYVTEAEGTAAGLLAQEHGGSYNPMAHLSKTLDLVIQGMPACLHAVVVSALMVSDSELIVLSHPLILHSLHQVV